MGSWVQVCCYGHTSFQCPEASQPVVPSRGTAPPRAAGVETNRTLGLLWKSKTGLGLGFGRGLGSRPVLIAGVARLTDVPG
jgi:hypothetical protein